MEAIEKRSPFKTAVATGYFNSPKLKNVTSKSLLDRTPIKNMLMNQKVLKVSSIKEAIRTATTIKKVSKPETIVKKTTVISRKRILTEISVVPSNDNIKDGPEIHSGNEKVLQEKDEIVKPTQKLRKSRSLIEIPTKLHQTSGVFSKLKKGNTMLQCSRI